MLGAGLVRLCPHFGPNGRVHESWHSRDGMMGVCQMDDIHIDNAIRMLLRSMRAISSREGIYDGWKDYDPDYSMTEERLDRLNRERRRREMVRKGWASGMNGLEKPGMAKTGEAPGAGAQPVHQFPPSHRPNSDYEIIQGDCHDLECQNGCQGGCLIRVLAVEPDRGEGLPDLDNDEPSFVEYQMWLGDDSDL